jgi:hypothetical protein
MVLEMGDPIENPFFGLVCVVLEGEIILLEDDFK